MVEERELSDGERAETLRQLREYWYRVMQVYDHRYSSQVHRRWWPAFRLLDDMKDHLPFLIDWLGNGKCADYEEKRSVRPESLIDFEEREERFRDPRRAFSSDQKRDLYFAAGGRCSICRVVLGSDWHADHFIPWSKGGETTVENGQALCRKCNSRKRARLLSGDEP